jgi:hypothetical protein
LLLRFHLFLFELHSLVALMAKRRIGLVAMMALRAFKIALLGYMVLVRVWLELFRLFSDSLDRFVAGETRLRRCRFFRLRRAVASVAGEVPFLVALCGGAALFLCRGKSSPERGRYDK